MKVNVQSVHFSADEKLISFIEKKVEKLVKISTSSDVDIILKLETAGTNDNKIVELKLPVPGKDVLFSKHRASSFEEGVVETVDKVRRQLLKIKD